MIAVKYTMNVDTMIITDTEVSMVVSDILKLVSDYKDIKPEDITWKLEQANEDESISFEEIDADVNKAEGTITFKAIEKGNGVVGYETTDGKSKKITIIAK